MLEEAISQCNQGKGLFSSLSTLSATLVLCSVTTVSLCNPRDGQSDFGSRLPRAPIATLEKRLLYIIKVLTGTKAITIRQLLPIQRLLFPVM
jgi:hypothetical protein